MSAQAAVHLHSKSDTFPLSFGQSEIWNREQCHETGGRCQHPAVYHLQGALRIEGLQLALNEIVSRHEILRTIYPHEDGVPLMRVQPPEPVALVTMDLRGLPEEDRDRRAWQLASEEIQRGFDLSRGPALRATLLRLQDSEYVLVLAVHALAWDEFSAEIALRELAEIYSGWIAQNLPQQLPELPLQYRDFVDRQQASTTDPAVAAEASYWKARLADSPALLSLPADRPRQIRTTLRCRRETLHVSRESSELLEPAAQREQVTIAELLLTVFQTLLFRYTGNEDIVVGIPFSCRTSDAGQSLGHFRNFSAIRTSFLGNPTFRELLVRVRSGCREAKAHKEVPFERLVEILNVPKPAGQTPVFQIIFAQIPESEAIGVSGLMWKVVDLDPATTQFDLTMRVTLKADGLACVLDYNADLFEAGAIRRMLSHYETLLESVLTDIDSQVSHLPILSKAERRQILEDWNATRKEFPEQCVHRLFEEQAERTPDATAVIGPVRRLTYAELNAAANRLAHCLQQLGVAPDVTVAVCIKPSVYLAVAILAVAKAGGTYVPLDPAHPQERLLFMRADADAKIVLCHRELEEVMKPFVNTVLPVEDWARIVTGQSAENPVSSVQPHNLAYILYTSGSTGKPKGVQICHRALVNLLWDMREWFDFRPEDCLLGITTISFDIAEVDLWLPLITGARSVLVSREIAADGMKLCDVLSTRDVTFLQATPATWQILLEAGWQGKKDLRAVCTGEAMPQALAEQLIPRTERLWDMYGPTETTIWSTGYELRSPGKVLIGKPVANTTTYILDQFLQPVPVGVVGELYIGGAGLAAGYVNQPEMTASRFIRHSFAKAPEERLYKTGDLARYLPDGNIEYLGRVDHQVKIRGFRIELAEVESVLAEYDGVHQAVVTHWKGMHERRGLVAYIVPGKNAEIPVADLRAFLKRKLPEQMLPAKYVFLPALPLTPTGKVDRGALPLPGDTTQNQRLPAPAPRDSLEAQLVKLWEEVLQTSPIGLQDDFFDLGGESLLAARLLALIQTTLGHRVSLSALFQAPTVARLAAVIRDPHLLRRSNVYAIQAGGSRAPFFCVGGGPLFRTVAKRLGADQPFLGLMPCEVDLLSMPYRVEEIAAHHVKILRETQSVGPYFLGGWSDNGVVAYEVAQQLRQQGQHVALLVLFDAENPAYRPDLDGLDLIRSRVDLSRQWLKLNYGLLQHSSPREAVSRIRRGAQFRREWLREKLREAIYRKHLRRGGQKQSKMAWDINNATAFAVKEYQPRPYEGRLVLFQRAARPRGSQCDPQFGWGELVKRLETCEIAGDHRDMFLEPHVETLADKLRDAVVSSASACESEA